MITQEDVVPLTVGPSTLAWLRGLGEKACIGGASSVRAGAERQAALRLDQWVGQIGTFAGTKYLTGSTEPYRQSRWFANRFPDRGDGGYDIPGLNLDFKASLMRGGPSPLSYRLAVRPHERHSGWIYVLVLVEPNTSTVDPKTTQVVHQLCEADPVRVHLVGWARDSQLPKEVVADGPFAGAFTLPAAMLNPLPPFRWEW